MLKAIPKMSKAATAAKGQHPGRNNIPDMGLIPAAQKVEHYEISTYWWFNSNGPKSRRDEVAEIPEIIL